MISPDTLLTARHRLRGLGERMLELIYPPTCILCGAEGHQGLDICAGCRGDLPAIAPCCVRCALPLAKGTPGTLLCGSCQRHAPPYTICRAALRYEDPLPTLVAGIKFRSKLNLVRLLGELLAEHLEAEAGADAGTGLAEAIIPVPLHRQRLRERGYNQALELARVVGRRLAVPVEPHCCRRTRATRPQMLLERRERMRNIRGAFEVIRPIHWSHVAILDDVVTTGGTVSELARVLKRAGCKRVDVWTLARTP